MAADINNYSLALALTLQTNADQVLGRVSSLVANIQNQVAAVAQSISAASDAFANDLSVQMKQMSDAAAAAAANVRDIAPGMEAVAAVADQTAAAHEQIADNTAAILQDQLDINKAVQDGSDVYLDINEALIESQKMQEDLGGGWSDHLKSLGKVLDLSNDQNGSYAEGVAQIINMAKAGGDVVENFLKLLGVWYLLDAAWQELAKDEERFVTLNYRLYGSQRELISQVNEVTAKYGVFRDVAMEAYQAMAGSMRAPQDELDDYVETVVKFNRTTGVAVSVTTDFSRQLRLSGYDLAEIEHRVRMFEFAMEQAGATTEEVGRLIQHQMKMNADRVGFWGKEAATAMTNQETLMWSLVRSTGANADALLELNAAALSSPMNIMQLKSMAWEYAAAVNAMSGANTINIETMTNQERIQLGLMSVMREAQDIMNSGMDEEIKLQLLGIKSGIALGGDYTQQLKVMAQAMNQLKDGGADLTSMQSIIESSFPDWEDKLAAMEAYNESIQSITATFALLGDKMRAMWSEMVISLAPIWLWFINNVATPMVEVLGVVIDVFKALAQVVVILASLLAPTWTILSNVIEGLWDAATMILQPFLDLIDALAGSFGNFTDNVSYFGDAIATVAQIVGVALAIYFAPWLVALSAISWALTQLINLFNGFSDDVAGTAKEFSILNTVSTALATAWEYLASVGMFFSNMMSAVSNGISEATEHIQEWWDTSEGVAVVFGLLSDSWTALSNALSDAFSSLMNAFRPLLELFGVLGDETSEASAFMEILELAAYGVAYVVGGVLKGIIIELTLILTGFIQAITWGINVVSTFVNASLVPVTWVLERISSLISPLITSIGGLFNAIMGEGSMASAAMDVFTNAVQLALWPLDLLAGALEYACSWFGASGAGIIEESEWAATALNNLAGPAATAGGALDSLTSSLQSIVSSISFLSGDGIANFSKNLSQLGNVDSGVPDDLNKSLEELTGSIPTIEISDSLNQSLEELKGSVPAINAVYSAVAAAITKGVTAVNAAADRAFGILNPLQLMIGGFGLSVQELFSNPIVEAPINAETISNIQIANKDEVGETMRQTSQEKRENENVELMHKLIDSVNAIKISPTAVNAILELLRQTLPNLDKDDTGLQTTLSNWRT